VQTYAAPRIQRRFILVEAAALQSTTRISACPAGQALLFGGIVTSHGQRLQHYADDCQLSLQRLGCWCVSRDRPTISLHQRRHRVVECQRLRLNLAKTLAMWLHSKQQLDGFVPTVSRCWQHRCRVSTLHVTSRCRSRQQTKHVCPHHCCAVQLTVNCTSCYPPYSLYPSTPEQSSSGRSFRHSWITAMDFCMALLMTTDVVYRWLRRRDHITPVLQKLQCLPVW